MVQQKPKKIIRPKKKPVRLGDAPLLGFHPTDLEFFMGRLLTEKEILSFGKQYR